MLSKGELYGLQDSETFFLSPKPTDGTTGSCPKYGKQRS